MWNSTAPFTHSCADQQPLSGHQCMAWHGKGARCAGLVGSTFWTLELPPSRPAGAKRCC